MEHFLFISLVDGHSGISTRKLNGIWDEKCSATANSSGHSAIENRMKISLHHFRPATHLVNIYRLSCRYSKEIHSRDRHSKENGTIDIFYVACSNRMSQLI